MSEYSTENNEAKFQTQIRKKMAEKRRQIESYMHKLRDRYDYVSRSIKDKSPEEKQRLKRVANTFLSVMGKFKDLYKRSVDKEEGRKNEDEEEYNRQKKLQEMQQGAAAPMRKGRAALMDANQPLLGEQQEKSELQQFTQKEEKKANFTSWQQATIDVEHQCEFEKFTLAVKLHQECEEVKGMFEEFAQHVAHQDEQLDVVFDLVDKSANNVELGVENIKQARTYQKQGRWVMFIILGVVLIVAVIAVLLVMSGALVRVLLVVFVQKVVFNY